MNIGYPFRFDQRGRTARVNDDGHVRDMIEELLFTTGGERVNRPDFGSGVMQMVFAPNGSEVAAAIQFTLQAALQRWLGDVVDLREVNVETDEAVLRVTVSYALRPSGDVQTATFERGSIR